MRFITRQFFLLLMVVGWAQPGIAQNPLLTLEGEPLKADLRILIDVSGSMKKNDPENLRRPAVELLSRLIPEPAEAGIWTFGDRAATLVPHERVTDAWRQLAVERVHSIGSTDMFTDLGAALEASLVVGGNRLGFRTSVILLTDGMVDISKESAANQREWKRVVEQVLPQFKDAGVAIHTIALSDQADRNLLGKLAQATDGLAATARTADELTPIFLRILNTAAPAEQLVVEGNRFQVDNSVQEFTALVFRSEAARTELKTPDGNTIGQDDRSSRINWYRAESYDLATVKQPQSGEWQLLGSAEPDSQVTVVSNLNLRVSELPVNVYRGQALKVSFGLQENDQLVTRPQFLSLMAFDLKLQYRSQESFETVWQTTLQPLEPPKSGIYQAQLPKFDREGDFQLLVQVDGKSFTREYRHSFSARTPFQSEILAQADDRGATAYKLELYPNVGELDTQRTQVVATLTTPANRRLVRPMPLLDEGYWQLPLQPRDTGRYGVAVTVAGVDENGVEFSYRLDEQEFYYSPERGLVAEPGGQQPVNLDLVAAEPVEQRVMPGTQQQAQPEPQPENMNAPNETEADGVQTEPEAPQAPAPSDAGEPSRAWSVYAGIGLGNLALLALGYWAYRRTIGREPSADEILEQFGDAKLQPVKASPTDSDDSAAAAPGILDEPEMEDLADPSNPDDPPTPQAPEDQLDPQQASESDPDEASLNEALASIMGELDNDEAPDDSFSLDEDDPDRR